MIGEDKRTVHGYRIIHSMTIGSQEMILGGSKPSARINAICVPRMISIIWTKAMKISRPVTIWKCWSSIPNGFKEKSRHSGKRRRRLVNPTRPFRQSVVVWMITQKVSSGSLWSLKRRYSGPNTSAPMNKSAMSPVVLEQKPIPKKRPLL